MRIWHAAFFYLITVLVLGGAGYLVGQNKSAANNPPQIAPDPTWKMVNDRWATFKVEGRRQSWGKPADVSMLILYEPELTPGTPKEYAVHWWVGNRQMREDFDSRESAMRLVEFIIENSTGETNQ